jgi:hypothetical protein
MLENKDSTKKIITWWLCVTSSMLFKYTIAKKIIEIWIPDEIYQDRRISIISSILWYKIGFIEESLVYYRVVPWNMSYKKEDRTNTDILDWRKRILELENLCCDYIIHNKIYTNNKQKKRCSNHVSLNNLFINFIDSKNIFVNFNLLKKVFCERGSESYYRLFIIQSRKLILTFSRCLSFNN